MMLPLEGIRVIDLSIMYAGPGSATYLGDMGAEVIKIERHAGDDSRSLASTPFLGRNSRAFMAVNRNKRGMVVDLTLPAGQEIVQRLARTADVLLHNFRPGVSERLGVDYATLSALNPRLIYAWVTAFGSRGPYADKPAYDNVIQGYSGIFDARARRDGEPTNTGTFAADTSMPMLLGYAVGAALWVREQTGRGQLIEASLLGAALASQSPHWIRVETERPSDNGASDPLERACPIVECADGAFVTVALVEDGAWRALCTTLGHAEWAGDSRFDSLAGRATHRSELDELLAPAFATRPAAEWAGLLNPAGVPCVPVVRRNDLLQQPYVTENNLLTVLAHPQAGPARVFNVPVRLSETPGSIRRAPPALGEHTREVLVELGYSPRDVEVLYQSNVVA